MEGEALPPKSLLIEFFKIMGRLANLPAASLSARRRLGFPSCSGIDRVYLDSLAFVGVQIGFMWWQLIC
jgi:hypothetical protein